MSAAESRRPVPSDFAAPPSRADLQRWSDADAAARPDRIAALRARARAEGLDALLLTSHADARYFSGICFGPNEEPTAGVSGWILISSDAFAIFADSRYTVQARREAALATPLDPGSDPGAAIAAWAKTHGVRNLGVDPGAIRHAIWERMREAAPGLTLTPTKGWGVALRAVKEPAEIERIAAACAVADRALAAVLPKLLPGATEAEVAWLLEREMREGGAEALAFDVAALAGANAALPHGNPGARPFQRGEVALFDFGAQVAGYRSDMTRTLFVGAASDLDLALYQRVLDGQRAAIAALQHAVESGASALPSGRAADDAARAAMGDVDGVYEHGLGHGIGLQTHESPSLSRGASEAPLPSPTVFSVEPGIYLEERIGIRIEDLVAVDLAGRSLSTLTRFPSAPLIVG
ncbi:MAG: aminopeptidase P family protein [Chloroflexi bacterium]|nr:MAG: aminopeptidase P family protein [Chloroflexota bacterium]